MQDFLTNCALTKVAFDRALQERHRISCFYSVDLHIRQNISFQQLSIQVCFCLVHIQDVTQVDIKESANNSTSCLCLHTEPTHKYSGWGNDQAVGQVNPVLRVH